MDPLLIHNKMVVWNSGVLPLLRGCIGCSLNFVHLFNVWQSKALAQGNHLTFFRLQNKCDMDKWNVAILAGTIYHVETFLWLYLSLKYHFVDPAMKLLERHWAEHLNAFNQIQFLFTLAFSWAVKQEVVPAAADRKGVPQTSCTS